MKPQRGVIGKILKIGIPSGIENGMFQVGKLLVSSLTAIFGTAAIAANAVANNVAGFANIPGSAIGLAMVTVIGRCIGAGEKNQAKRYSKKLLVTFSVCATAIWPLSFTLPNALRAAGDARYTMGVSVFSMWVFRVASSYFFRRYIRIWSARCLDWNVCRLGIPVTALCRALSEREMAGKTCGIGVWYRCFVDKYVETVNKCCE